MEIAFSLAQPARLAVERGGDVLTLTLTPQIITRTDDFGNKGQVAIIGVRSGPPVYTRLGPIAALAHGAGQTAGFVRMTGAVLGQFVSGARSIKEMGGPVRIAKTSGEAATLGFEQLIFFAAFLSINKIGRAYEIQSLMRISYALFCL